MESILPLKSLVLIDALDKHAKSFEYVFKTDDDSMLDVKGLGTLLAQEEKEGKPIDYWGTCWPRSPVVRDPKHKWYIPFTAFARDTYPLYCVGAGYLLSRRATTCIPKMMESLEPFMPMEDVAIGLMVEMCKMKPYKLKSVDVFNYFDWALPIWLAKSKANVIVDTLDPMIKGYRNMVLFHKVNTAEQMRFLWNNGKPIRETKPANIVAAMAAAKRGMYFIARGLLRNYHPSNSGAGSTMMRATTTMMTTKAEKKKMKTTRGKPKQPKERTVEEERKIRLPHNVANTKRKRLLITSAGDSSNVRQWVSSDAGARTFDVVVMYYGNEERFEHAEIVDHWRKMKGTKFPNLKRLVHAFPEWFKRYDSVAVFDDDIEITPMGLEDLFIIREATQHTVRPFAYLLDSGFLDRTILRTNRIPSSRHAYFYFSITDRLPGSGRKAHHVREPVSTPAVRETP